MLYVVTCNTLPLKKGRDCLAQILTKTANYKDTTLNLPETWVSQSLLLYDYSSVHKCIGYSCWHSGWHRMITILLFLLLECDAKRILLYGSPNSPQYGSFPFVRTSVQHGFLTEQIIWAKLMRRATVLAVFIRRLFWSISIHFDSIHSWNPRQSHKLQKH